MRPSKGHDLEKWPEPLWKTRRRQFSRPGGRSDAPRATGDLSTNVGRSGSHLLTIWSGQAPLFATIGLIVAGAALLALGMGDHSRPLVFGSLLCISPSLVLLALFYSGWRGVGSGSAREEAGVAIDRSVSPRPSKLRHAVARYGCAPPCPWPGCNGGSQIMPWFNYSNAAFPVNRPGDDTWGAPKQFEVGPGTGVRLPYESSSNILDLSHSFPSRSLKPARESNKFTTLTSPGGSPGDQVGSAPMTGAEDSAIIGLLVTSHNLGLIGSTTSTDVATGTW